MTRSKVPEATALFWIIKVLTTGMGETTSDYLVRTIDPVVAVGLGASFLVAALALQFSVQRYLPGIYWFTVAMVSVFGTMAADVTHIVLGVPYAASATAFALALAAVFLLWYRTEGTLSIHSITSARREMFYWLTVLATFALGTAVGDLTATTFGLGYLASGIVFACLFALPGIGYRLTRLNGVAAFWIAYVLTRPLGASFADWMGVTTGRGGLGWGTGPVSMVLAGIILALVIAVSAIGGGGVRGRESRVAGYSGTADGP
jgi:uncharacterized membrane-anchored protein